MFAYNKIKGHTLQTEDSALPVNQNGGIAIYKNILFDFLFDKIEKWPVDGSTTISPAEAQQPADTENFSALDQSSGSKGTENTSNAQENNENNQNLNLHPKTGKSMVREPEGDVRFSVNDADIELLNKKFNEELLQQIEGTLPPAFIIAMDLT